MRLPRLLSWLRGFGGESVNDWGDVKTDYLLLPLSFKLENLNLIMELSEAKKLKLECEAKITEALTLFTNQTGLEPEKIDIIVNKYRFTNMPNVVQIIANLKVEI